MRVYVHARALYLSFSLPLSLPISLSNRNIIYGEENIIREYGPTSFRRPAFCHLVQGLAQGLV